MHIISFFPKIQTSVNSKQKTSADNQKQIHMRGLPANTLRTRDRDMQSFSTQKKHIFIIICEFLVLIGFNSFPCEYKTHLTFESETEKKSLPRTRCAFSLKGKTCWDTDACIFKNWFWRFVKISSQFWIHNGPCVWIFDS